MKGVYENLNSEVGISVIDLVDYKIDLLQFLNDYACKKLINKLVEFTPKEIIVSSRNPKIGILKRELDSTHLKNIKITRIDSKYFDKKKGFELCTRFMNKENNEIENSIIVKKRSKSQAAMAALIVYLELELNVYIKPFLVSIHYKHNENSVFIDSGTCKFLELTTCGTKTGKSVIDVLNFCKTKNGEKMLRSSILEPSIHLNSIEEKIEAVTFIATERGFLPKLEDVLKMFNGTTDILRFFQRSSEVVFQGSKSNEKKFKVIYVIRNALKSIHSLIEICQNSHSKSVILSQICQELINDNRFTKLYEEIEKIIDFESLRSSNLPSSFLIKPNLNGLFDVSRRSFAEAVDEIIIYSDEISRTYDIPIKIAFNVKRGYYFRINLNQIPSSKRLPVEPTTNDEKELNLLIKSIKSHSKDFVKITKVSKSLQFTTKRILQLNERLKETQNDFDTMCNSILDQLISQLQKDVDYFYKIHDIISTLDMLFSFSKYTLTSCGSFSAIPLFKKRLLLVNASHPLLQSLHIHFKHKKQNSLVSNVRSPTVNNVVANDINPFILITGANMSGKSTLLKQIGIQQIMAQSGCHVPASIANFHPKKKVLSRAGEGYSKLNRSSFEHEMHEIKNILENMDSESLILIDELCRSTNYNEGLAISISLCEFIIDRIEENFYKHGRMTFVFYASHYTEISCLEYIYQKVTGIYLESFFDEGDTKRLNHSYRVSKGFCNEENYGINILKISNFPDQLIQDANHYSNYFQKNLRSLFLKKITEKKIRLILEFHAQISKIAPEFETEDISLVDDLTNLINTFEMNYENIIGQD